MAKRPPPSVPQPKQFSLPEIDVGIRKLRRRLEQVQMLDPATMEYNDPRVDTAESAVRETILEVFGASSPEFEEHRYHDIWKGSRTIGPDRQAQAKFAAGIGQSTVMLEGLIARLEEKRIDLAPPPAPAMASSLVDAEPGRRVFIVHGHDEAAREVVARFVEHFELEPIVLSERANEGRTIIEKFEHHADVSFAIILLTPDDIGFPRSEPEHQRSRARQNVILELGYFIGRLTRSRVCALYKGAVELPSDLHGVLYVQMDDGGGWRLRLAKEMKAARLDVDMNRAL